jgi:hypothetical protein
MTFDCTSLLTCDPFPLANDLMSYRGTVLRYLQLIAANAGGGSTPVTLTPLAMVNPTPTTAYLATGLVDSSKKLRKFTVNNRSDTQMRISLDGTHDYAVIPPYTAQPFNFGAYQYTVVTDLYIKSDVASPTGSVYIEEAYY